jgi:hypothetical protein
MSFALVPRTAVADPSAAVTRIARLDLASFTARSGLHPDLVRRLVTLGLLEAERDAAGELSFAPGQLAAAARLQRLRAGFSLNYAALGLVVDLLDRIAVLESTLRQHAPTPGGRSWT